jgi:DNA modification methylase
MIKNSSRTGEVVMDAFLGSGSTIIACERLGRRCFGLEIDPRYVDVAVRRWELHTGNKALKIE